jgi:hypothetical protein
MEPLIFMGRQCIEAVMHRGLGHPSVPFLLAALTALALYRIAETGLGLSGHDIFAFGLGGAALMAAVLALTYWTRRPRRG